MKMNEHECGFGRALDDSALCNVNGGAQVVVAENEGNLDCCTQDGKVKNTTPAPEKIMPIRLTIKR